MDSSKRNGYGEFRRRQKHYRRTFLAAYGPFPHPCHFCGEEVDGHTAPLDGMAAVIHHLDHDETNDALENLAPAHHGCHMRYHQTEKWRSPEYRATIGPKLSAALTAMYAANGGRSPETKAKLAAANEGKRHSPESRAKMSAARKGKRKSAETRERMSAAMRVRWEDPQYRARTLARLTASRRVSHG